MRPLKLTIEGIKSYTDRQTLDFSELGDGLFCISGQTGSGKSTILDSILIALYGDGKHNIRIGEYINTGMEKAEVEFDFLIGEIGYRVKRTLSKTGTNRAALYRLDDDTLIADQPMAVNSAILSLVGLELNTFTRVVILQQGEFDVFLHSTPADRRDIVGKLFKLSRYEKLYSRFNAYCERLNGEIATLDSAAAGYAYADETRLLDLETEVKRLRSESEESKKRLDEINKRKSELEVIKKLYDESEAKRELAAKLSIECEELKQKIEGLKREKAEQSDNCDLQKIRDNEKQAMLEVQRLKGLRPSLRLYAEKNEELKKVRELYKKLNFELKKEREKNDMMNKHRSEIAAVLKQSVAAITSGYSSERFYGREGISELKTFLGSLKTEVLKAENLKANIADLNAERDAALKKRNDAALIFRQIAARENDVRIELSRAEDSLSDSKKELEDLRSLKALSSVVRELRIGDNCPVCGNRITFIKTADDSDFSEAEKRLSFAEDNIKKLNEELSKLKIEAATSSEAAAAGQDVISKCDLKIKELSGSLKLIPKTDIKDLENAEKCCALIDKTDPEIVSSEHNIKLKLQEIENINGQGLSLRADIDKLSETLGEVKPESDIDSLIAEAEKKAALCSAELKNAERNNEALSNAIIEAEKQLGAIDARLENLNEQLSNRIAYDAAEYILTGSRAVEAEHEYSENAKNLAKKSAELDAAKRDAELLKNLTVRKAKLVKNADRASKIAKLVKGDGFLDFVAREYVESFTERASEIMQELSSGQYSLELSEKGEFMIRDFFRDNSLRNVGTLSGGETFLASLSMAVAISRELSQFAGCGFFFLDEGFGTLDSEYITVVYESLERLSRDTMVGLVTHNAELIELVSNSVEIVKADSGSGSKILRK